MHGASASQNIRFATWFSMLSHYSTLSPLCLGCWEAQNEASSLLLDGTVAGHEPFCHLPLWALYPQALHPVEQAGRKLSAINKTKASVLACT